MNNQELNNLHKELRKHRYLYYEMHTNIISDYEYDMLEKEYTKACNELNVPQDKRINNFVGFSINIPMILINE